MATATTSPSSLPPLSHLLRMEHGSTASSTSGSSSYILPPALSHARNSASSGRSASTSAPASPRTPGLAPLASPRGPRTFSPRFDQKDVVKSSTRRAPPPPLTLAPPPLSGQYNGPPSAHSSNGQPPLSAVSLSRKSSDERRNIDSLLNVREQRHPGHPSHRDGEPMPYAHTTVPSRPSPHPPHAHAHPHSHPHPHPVSAAHPGPYPEIRYELHAPPRHAYPPAYAYDAPPPSAPPFVRRHTYHPGYANGTVLVAPAPTHHQGVYLPHGGHPHPGAALIYADGLVPVSYHDGGMRAPISRTTKACDACRARKVRCNDAGHPAGCNRCQESKRQCVYSTTQKKRGPTPGGKLTRQSSTNQSSAPTRRPQSNGEPRRESLEGNSGPSAPEDRSDTWSAASDRYAHEPRSAPAHPVEAWPWSGNQRPETARAPASVASSRSEHRVSDEPPRPRSREHRHRPYDHPPRTAERGAAGWAGAQPPPNGPPLPLADAYPPAPQHAPVPTPRHAPGPVPADHMFEGGAYHRGHPGWERREYEYQHSQHAHHAPPPPPPGAYDYPPHAYEARRFHSPPRAPLRREA